MTIRLIIPTAIVDSLMRGCFQGPKRVAPGLSRNEECRNKKTKKTHVEDLNNENSVSGYFLMYLQ